MSADDATFSWFKRADKKCTVLASDCGVTKTTHNRDMGERDETQEDIGKREGYSVIRVVYLFTCFEVLQVCFESAL